MIGAIVGSAGPRALSINPIGPITGPIGGAIGGAIGGVVGGAVSASTRAILDAVSEWVAHGAASLLGSLVRVLDAQTSPTLLVDWFGQQYGLMLAVAGLLAMPLLVATAMTSIARQDAGPLMRAVFVQLPLAAIGTGVAINVVNLALAATDELCAIVASNTGSNTDALFVDLARALDRVPGAGGFAVMIVACIVAFAAFVLTLELVVRSAATYVAMLFLPVALIGLIWPATARWGRRVAEMLAALILSKFVVVAVLSLAVAALRGGVEGQGLSGLFTGAALLLLACVAPFALLRMVPVIEAGAVSHLDGAGRRVAASPMHARQNVLNLQKMLNESGARPPGGEPPVEGGGGMPTEGARRGMTPDGRQIAEDGSTPRIRAGPGGVGPGGAGPGGAGPGGAGPGAAGPGGAGGAGPGGAGPSGAGLGGAGLGGAGLGGAGLGGAGLGGAGLGAATAGEGGAAAAAGVATTGVVAAPLAVAAAGVTAGVAAAKSAANRVRSDAEQLPAVTP